MKKECINILFLGGAKRVSLAEHLINAGKQLDKEVGIFSYELAQEVPIAIVGKVVTGKKWKDPLLYNDLQEVIRQYHINMVLPFVDSAIEVAARLKPLVPEVFIPVSPPGICQTMFDKNLANLWFVSQGVPVPTYYDLVDTSHLPLILKPRLGSASKGIIILKDVNNPVSGFNPADYLIQEYIPDGEEYTVDCYVAQNGEIISVVPRIRMEVAGGEAVSSCTVNDDELIQLSTYILATGVFRGPVTIQFIRSKITKKTYIMEINPRLGGAVVASIAAGANIPDFLIREACGETLSPVTKWKENTLMTRYFKEVIFYADNH